MIVALSVKNILLFIFITQTISVRCVRVISNEQYVPKTIDIINDLPIKKDLYIYLKSLEQILEFFSEHKRSMNLNALFGSILINVNLKYIDKGHLTMSSHNNLIKIIGDNSHFIESLKKSLMYNQNSTSEKMRILALISNEQIWSKHTKKLDLKLLQKTEFHTQQQLYEIYGEWSNYIDKVNDFEKAVPSPRLSDMCMESLIDNPINYSDLSKCKTLEPCYNMLTNGSDFGYGMLHRLLFLIMARYGRGCSIFSQQEDGVLIDKLCVMANNELNYIVLNNYKIPDLMLEQICLCTLEGHAQFLQRSWLQELLKFQSPHGCFGVQPARRDVINEVCNIHVTAVAAAVMAAAARFIIGSYYN